MEGNTVQPYVRYNRKQHVFVGLSTESIGSVLWEKSRYYPNIVKLSVCENLKIWNGSLKKNKKTSLPAL